MVDRPPSTCKGRSIDTVSPRSRGLTMLIRPMEKRSSTTIPAVLSIISRASSLCLRMYVELTWHECASKGYRVNWRSYDRQASPQAQAEPQYAVQAAAPIPRATPRQRGHQARARAQPQPQPQQQQQPEVAPNYRPYANAPPQIQQLLQFQQQIPYINIIPEAYRYETMLIRLHFFIFFYIIDTRYYPFSL